jgi:hypothetical protein
MGECESEGATGPARDHAAHRSQLRQHGRAPRDWVVGAAPREGGRGSGVLTNLQVRESRANNEDGLHAPQRARVAGRHELARDLVVWLQPCAAPARAASSAAPARRSRTPRWRAAAALTRLARAVQDGHVLRAESGQAGDGHHLVAGPFRHQPAAMRARPAGASGSMHRRHGPPFSPPPPRGGLALGAGTRRRSKGGIGLHLMHSRSAGADSFRPPFFSHVSTKRRRKTSS